MTIESHANSWERHAKSCGGEPILVMEAQLNGATVLRILFLHPRPPDRKANRTGTWPEVQIETASYAPKLIHRSRQDFSNYKNHPNEEHETKNVLDAQSIDIKQHEDRNANCICHSQETETNG
jgi:hypothetical protein